MTPSAVRRTGPWIALALLGGLAIWLYEPWRSRPFDILDFSDFLGRLAGGSGFLDRLGELTAFYREQHGRFNVVSYAGLAAKWEIFGASPLAWQLFRAAQLLTAAGLTYLLLRRLSAGATGAVLGAGLVLFSYSSSHAWVRLTLGEPLGLLCVLLASLLAVQSRTDREWRVLAIASGLLVGIAILAKEMLVAWAPIVAYLGCVVDEKGRLGALGAPDRQGRWVLASVGIATAAASIPVIVAVMGQQGESYARLFGRGGLGLPRILEIAQRMIFPWPANRLEDPAALALPAALFAVTLLLGLASTPDPLWTRHARRAMALGLALPVLATALYTPWPVYWAPYGLPFVFGPALMLATAVTSAESRSKVLGLAARVAAGACLLLVIPPSVRLARQLAARQEVNVAVARSLLDRSGTDSTIVAVAVLPEEAEHGLGATLRRYAATLEPAASLPPARDAQCREVGERIRRGLGRSVIISYSDHCGQFPVATLVVRRTFRYFDFTRLSLATDSIRADLYDPLRPPRR